MKGRTALSIESTLTRMNRLGSSVLTGIPLLTLDEIVAAIDAVTRDDVAALAASCSTPSGCRRQASAATRTSSARALEPVNPALGRAA